MDMPRLSAVLSSEARAKEEALAQARPRSRTQTGTPADAYVGHRGYLPQTTAEPPGARTPDLP